MKFQWVIFLFLSFLLSVSSLAQDFGEISDEELQLTGIDEDPEANIVILFNKGKVKISPHFHLEMDVHKRIKILSEAGKDYANITINFWHEDKIKDLEAISYSPDGTKHELDDDDIFEERTKKWKKKVFAIPGVEVGSVIEYKYTLYSDYINNLEIWFFQSDEYTKVSEITVYLPIGFRYSALEKNLVNYQLDKTSELARNPFELTKKCTKYIWRLTNVPGIKNEPYMKAKHDYYAQILFQLVSYKDQYIYQSFAKKWDDIAERIWNKLKYPIDQDGGLEDFVKEQTEHCTTDEEKAAVLYNFVRSQIKTTKNVGFLSDDLKEPEDVIEEKSASTNAKNLLLINLLNHVGLKAKPLLISTRSNGQLKTDWVQILQLNRMITYLKIGRKIYYLNPGAKYSPFGMLTPEYAAQNGLLISESKGQIVTIKSPKPKGTIKIKTNAKITEDGEIYCTSDIIYSGINAVLKRNAMDNEDLDEYIEDYLSDMFADVVIDSFNIVNMDSIEKSLEINIKYHVPDYLENAGPLAIFEVPLLIREDKNPFVRDKRDFPVDFDFETYHSEIVNISFPKSMKLNEIPSRTSTKMKKLKFIKIYFDSKDGIEVTRSYRLGRTRFRSFEYSKLKQIFEKIVQSDQDKIVLSKS